VEPSSADLLDQYRHGDEAAATPLFARYVERLTAMVRSQMTPSLRRRIDPEDAVQSAYRSFFVRVRDGQFTLQRSGELWKLLVTITLNKLRRQIAHHQTHKRAVERDRAFGEFVDVGGEPSPLEALAAADELTAFMAKLNPLQRQVLQMRLQEQRWDEIAKATGRAPRTVRRVLEEIRRIWSGMVPSPEPNPNRERIEQHSVPPLPPVPAAIAAPPALLDYRGYVLEQHIGSGGMGKVYRVRRLSDGQRVAVKMLRKARWNQLGAVERFLEEARIVGTLHHPGIVEVHGVGRTPGGGPFIAMEYIDGDNLATITAHRQPSPSQALEWVAAAADALHYAHQQGIVHCDLKPSNLLRESTGRVVLSDFGLAATRTPSGDYQLWGGTRAYMAPEQLDPAFGSISPVTDVFALGLVLFNLITGRTLLAEGPILEVLATWRDGAAMTRAMMTEGGIPGALAEVLERCLVVNPAGRLTSARVLAETLRNLIPGLPSLD
jgi:RNA polymerase sigma factor (sigma-70 family)